MLSELVIRVVLMTSKSNEKDSGLRIAVKTVDLMKTWKSPAHPRSYEVWYSYLSGGRDGLTASIKTLMESQDAIGGREIEKLHDEFLSPHRLPDQAEKASAGIVKEIANVMEMIDMAMGSTEKYGKSLEAYSNDLDGQIDRTKIREVVQSLVLATNDISATNKALEARLHETKSEINSLRESLEVVRIESLTDPLTGIANRKHFEEMLLKSVDHAAVERAPLALIVIDIDHFKHFNDTYGHLTGDQVLRLVSMTMRERVKTKATLARFGGEEFGVIMPDTTIDSARATAEIIRQSVMSRELVKRSTGESLGKVTISVGVSAFKRGDTAMVLLGRADQCMYQAKRTGRNKTVCDYEMPEDMLNDVA
jgi:diguanylate cyclase